MATRSKAFLKQAKSARKKEQKLDTADDYQAAGVEHEDAAGKWRAGDPEKSMRFFRRAIEVYEQGLQKFPQSFDLAYNKARVELEVATHPILVKQLPVSVLDALRVSLESHRYALNLDQDNTDIIFNTSQVLTSIAEEIAKDDLHPDADALPLLEQALELQNRCLQLQEQKYSEQEQKASEPTEQSYVDPDSDHEDGGASLATSTTAQEDQWFSIVEPITQDTLIDTVLAQLGTLTVLCGIISNAAGSVNGINIRWIQDYSSKLLNDKLPAYMKGQSERQTEIAVTKATLIASLLDAAFCCSTLDVETYKRELDVAFSQPELQVSANFEASSAKSRALIAWNLAVADSATENNSVHALARWNALNVAMATLTAASKLPAISQEDKAQSHFMRGDVSLLQHQLGYPPISLANAISGKAQLAKNAKVYYVNAGKLSPSISDVATKRAAIADALQNDMRAHDIAGQVMNDVVEDMITEGLIPQNYRSLPPQPLG